MFLLLSVVEIVLLLSMRLSTYFSACLETTLYKTKSIYGNKLLRLASAEK